MTHALGDIWLNGKAYRVDVKSYRDRDAVDFAPRAGTPGGSIVHSELGLYQPLLQTDWQHGFGFQWYEDAQGYLSTVGNIDTRHDGLAMLFTTATASDTNDAVKEGFVVWNNILWTWGADGLRRFDGSWTAPYTATAVNFAMASGDYLFYCPDGARLRKVDTADNHTDAGNDSDSTDYKWLVQSSGYIYAGKDGTNHIHRDSTSDLSDLEGTTADPDIIYVGNDDDSYPTLGAIVYGGTLYIYRADGLWSLGDDLIARRILNFSSEASADNFRGMAEHNGYLIFPIRDKVYQWNGARLSDVTPPRITDTFPFTTYGRFDNFVSMGRFLYCTARTNESTYNEDLMCFDGVGWHKLMRLVSNGTDTITAMGYDPYNNYLWYHLDASADTSYYIPFQSASEFPYAAFPTSGTNYLVSSRFDMGYRWVDKSSPTLFIEAYNLSSTCYLKPYYSLDNGAWTAWSDENVTTSGITKLKYPGGLQSVEYNQMKIRIDFVTNSAAQSPILESFTLRFIMRPNDFYSWSFNIPIAQGMDLGETVQHVSVAEVLQDLKIARSSKSPIEFVDLFGERHLVYMTSNVGQVVSYELGDGGPYPNLEVVRSINLVEAKD